MYKSRSAERYAPAAQRTGRGNGQRAAGDVGAAGVGINRTEGDRAGAGLGESGGVVDTADNARNRKGAAIAVERGGEITLYKVTNESALINTLNTLVFGGA